MIINYDYITVIYSYFITFFVYILLKKGNRRSVQKFHPQNLVTRLTPLNIFYFISFLPSAFAPEYPFCQKVWVLPKCTNTLAKPIITTY